MALQSRSCREGESLRIKTLREVQKRTKLLAGGVSSRAEALPSCAVPGAGRQQPRDELNVRLCPPFPKGILHPLPHRGDRICKNTPKLPAIICKLPTFLFLCFLQPAGWPGCAYLNVPVTSSQICKIKETRFKHSSVNAQTT